MTLIWPGYSSSFSIVAGDLGARAARRASSSTSLGLDDHADLAAGLHGVRPSPRRRGASAISSSSSRRLTYVLERLAAGAGPRAGQGVGDLDDHRLDGLRLDLVVVRLHRVARRPRAPCSLRASSPPTSACGPSISWSTALPMSCSSAARRAILTLAPSSAAMHAASQRALDRVLAARSGRSTCGSCRRPSSLVSSGWSVADVGLEHRLLAHLDDVLSTSELAPGRRPPRCAPGGCGRPAISFSSASRAISRRTRSKPESDHRSGRVVDDEVDRRSRSRARGCCGPRGR